MEPRRCRPAFDPLAHREALEPLVAALARAEALDPARLDRLVRRHPRRGSGLFSKSEIIAGFRAFGAPGVSEAEFTRRLRLRPVRTLSGVTPLTVLTRPFPCPGACIFCPSDVRMPKSYLADEPGAQRAEDHAFDPYRQTWSRLAAYRDIGHPVDKVELIVLGGTWSAYPEPYRVWFVLRCLEALHDFGAGADRRDEAEGLPALDHRALAPIHGAEGRRYNDVVGGLLAQQLPAGRLHDHERTDWEALAAAQRANETAACRCVGLSLETRPDEVSEAEVLRLRRLGATKVQLGLQSLDDAVLRANRRGHDVAAARRAIARLRAAGFKVQAHWMPNLLGATPASDRRDFARLFDDPDFRPDELKLYPCLLVESAPLVRHHARAEWQPYDDDTLAALLADCMAATPRTCRLTRVVRDFSSHDIAAGTRVANLREVAERLLAERGVRCVEVRSREIRGGAFEVGALRLATHTYDAGGSEERFLEWVTPDDRLVAFLRLSLPKQPSFVPELGDAALVRELHVYGSALPLGARDGRAAQHAGLGRRLLDEAARQAARAGHARLAVISAVGTRAYYRAHGFEDGALYQHRRLAPGAEAGAAGGARAATTG